MADGKEVTANTNEDPIEAALTTTRNIVVNMRQELERFVAVMDEDIPDLPPFKELTLPNKANETIYSFAEAYKDLAGAAIHISMRHMTLQNLVRRLRYLISRNPQHTLLLRQMTEVEDVTSQFDTLHARAKEKLDYIDKSITTLKSIKNTIVGQN